MELMHKVAIVTGAGRGIGKQTAIDLAAEGCAVVIASRSEHELAETSEVIRQSGGSVLACCLDLAEKASPEKLMEATLQAFGPPDILINNAGVLHLTSFLGTALEDWELSMNINARAAFLLGQLAMRHMIARKSGYIINLASTAAINPGPLHGAYGTAKNAVIGLSKVMLKTGKPHGVKVSTVYPGMTDTRMVRDHLDVGDNADRLMTPGDIANAILFLLRTSDRCLIPELVVGEMLL